MKQWEDILCDPDVTWGLCLWKSKSNGLTLTPPFSPGESPELFPRVWRVPFLVLMLALGSVVLCLFSVVLCLFCSTSVQIVNSPQL